MLPGAPSRREPPRPTRSSQSSSDGQGEGEGEEEADEEEEEEEHEEDEGLAEEAGGRSSDEAREASAAALRRCAAVCGSAVGEDSERTRPFPDAARPSKGLEPIEPGTLGPDQKGGVAGSSGESAEETGERGESESTGEDADEMERHAIVETEDASACVVASSEGERVECLEAATRQGEREALGALGAAAETAAAAGRDPEECRSSVDSGEGSSSGSGEARTPLDSSLEKRSMQAGFLTAASAVAVGKPSALGELTETPWAAEREVVTAASPISNSTCAPSPPLAEGGSVVEPPPTRWPARCMPRSAPRRGEGAETAGAGTGSDGRRLAVALLKVCASHLAPPSPSSLSPSPSSSSSAPSSGTFSPRSSPSPPSKKAEMSPAPVQSAQSVSQIPPSLVAPGGPPAFQCLSSSAGRHSLRKGHRDGTVSRKPRTGEGRPRAGGERTETDEGREPCELNKLCTAPRHKGAP